MGTSASTIQDSTIITSFENSNSFINNNNNNNNNNIENNNNNNNINNNINNNNNNNKEYLHTKIINANSFINNNLINSTNNGDGYKWRKYGQKQVKGTKFPRSYYKCTFPGCTVKKYVEKTIENNIEIEKVYYRGGEHNHDASKITKLNATDQITFKHSVLTENLIEHQSLSVQNYNHQENQSSIILATSSSVSPLYNLTKTNISNTNNINTNNILSSPRLVIETTTDVDFLDDGYSWRKYGQKRVKGCTNPRNYYKCSEEDCLVKKQVEQRGNTIINTYEGTHNHPAPGYQQEALKKKKKRKIMKSISSPTQEFPKFPT